MKRSFRYTTEKYPKIWKTLAKRDVCHITRPPVDNPRADPFLKRPKHEEWIVMYEEYDNIHNSHNIIYKTPTLRSCRSTPVPGNTLRYLQWQYDTTKQIARPHLPKNIPRDRSVYVKEAFPVDKHGVKTHKPMARSVLHPHVAEQRVAAPADIGARIALAARAKCQPEVDRLYAIFDSPTLFAMAYY